MNNRQYITAAEAARRLGVGRSTICRWIKTGKLPARAHSSGKWQIPQSLIDALIAEIKADNGASAAHLSDQEIGADASITDEERDRIFLARLVETIAKQHHQIEAILTTHQQIVEGVATQNEQFRNMLAIQQEMVEETSKRIKF